MYKSIWARVLACLTVVVVLSLSVLPLMANADQVNFGDITPNFSDTFFASIENPGGQSNEQKQMYINLVDTAYKIGLFGGAYPVMIAMTKTADLNTGYRLEVFAVPAMQSLLEDTAKARGWYIRVSVSGITTFTRQVGADLYSFPTVQFIMGLDGSWSPSQVGVSQVKAGNGVFTDSAGNQTGKRLIVAVRAENGRTWINPSYNANFGFVENGTGYNAPTSNIITSYDRILANFNQGVQSGFTDGYEQGQEEGFEIGYRDGHADGYTEGFLAGSPQMVEIENIITAVPQGLKSILDNSLDFEIFDINVAGLLSVLLIVSIVGFVVKWLMTR